MRHLPPRWRRRRVCRGGDRWARLTAVERAENQPLWPTRMQPDRQKHRAKEFHCKAVLYGAAEPSGESFSHCVLASCGKQRLIALR